mgnify:CR=1 FL=1
MRFIKTLLFAVFFFLLVTYPHKAEAASSIYPKKTTINEIGKTYQGFTLFTPLSGHTGPSGSNEVYLVDMKGKVVHSWKAANTPGLYGFLLKNGNLMYAGNTEEFKEAPTPGGSGVISEIDWSGKVVWEYRDKFMHHDFAKLPNGNLMVIAWEKMTDENKARIVGGLSRDDNAADAWSDVYYEVDYKTKQIVWKWSGQEQLEIEKFPIGPLEDRKEWMHSNSISYLPKGNSFNGRPGILVSVRNTDTVMIIDYETKEVTWNWGKDSINNQHDATLLTNGNLLIFDNGMNRDFIVPSSRVVEVNPVTNKIEWEYVGDGLLGSNFFSSLMSGAQRLPNGNTLITESLSGRIFEVTRGVAVPQIVKEFPDFLKSKTYDNEIVWEYNSPYSVSPVAGPAIFKARRYSEKEINWPVKMPNPNPSSLIDTILGLFK